MLSFIILTYNTEKFIEQCLTSIFKYAEGINFEIVVKDNNSGDKTVEIIEKFIKNNKNIKLIKSKTNSGFAGGNNDAVKHSKGDLLFFLNADAVLSKYDHKKTVELFNSDQTISIIQPKLRKMTDPNVVESTGHFIDILGNTFIENENAANKKFPTKQIFAATGAAFIMKGEVFKKLGGFDEEFFLFYEETDLCWRNNLLGYKVYYFDDLEVFHFGGGSVNKGKQREKAVRNYKIAHYYLRNKFISGIKNIKELDLLLFFIFNNFLLYLFASLFYLLKGDFKYSGIIIKSLFLVIYSMPTTLKKKKNNEKIFKFSNRGLINLGLITKFNFLKWIKKILFLVLISFTIGNTIFAYVDQNFSTPLIYTPRNIIVTSQTVETLTSIISNSHYEANSVIYFKSQNKNISNEILERSVEPLPLFNIENGKINAEEKKEILIIEFKKINTTKYKVVVHQARKDFPLVFSESFHEGWKVYLVKSGEAGILPQAELFNRASNYKILDGNEEDQASLEELKEFIENGWISTLGDLKEKEIKHKKWEDGKEKLDYVEKYNIDFISKNFQDTIQNDNLPDGRFYETWLKDYLPEENHLTVNGYANSWIINTEEICGVENSKCVQNPDGSYNFEMVIEFWPQRFFYLGLGISSITLLACLGYLGYNWRRKKKILK